jgi:anti-anti-sigma factor
VERPYQYLEVRQDADVFCVRLRRFKLDEGQLFDMCNELVRVVEVDGCRKMVLNLGPPDLEFLYSIFLAKLVSLQRRLHEVNGALKLAGAGPATYSIFQACRLEALFDFLPDEAAALRALTRASEDDAGSHSP